MGRVAEAIPEARWNEADNLWISKVIHQANIDVDEKVVEVAAATAFSG